jgi:hypothetical protein
MPPKKDVKKGAVPTFEIDPATFNRDAAEYPTAGDGIPPLREQLKSTLAKVDSVLPIWSTEGINWSEAIAPEEVFSIKYPEHITVSQGKALRAYLNLDVEEAAPDPKAKGKKPEPKKGAVADALAEPAVDEATGKTLPRMFLENVDVQNVPVVHSGFTPAWPFYRKQDSGEFVDPLVVAALEIIARVGPTLASLPQSASITGDGARAPKCGMQYLWRSIYPKLPGSERPCYNPAGKYGVRLYLGGQWRLVSVTDEVPLDADGERAVACSSNPLELWPMIIAKAVYTAYTKCGYLGSLGNPLDAATHGACTRSAAYFTAFVVHVLTGWQPGSPLNLAECLEKDPARIRTLRDEIVFGGAANLPAASIPRPSEELLEAENKPPSSPKSGANASEFSAAAAAAAASSAGSLRTKKQYKEEYQRKLSEREAVIAALQEREAQIAHIDSLSRGTFSEVFNVCFRDSQGRLRVNPVLAVSYADEGSLEDTALLLRWEVVKKPVVIEAYVDLSTLSAVEQYKASLPKLPKPTEIVMEWVTIRELCAASGFVSALDTSVRTPSEAVLPWGWKADEPAEDAAAKGKAKAPAKGKEAAPAASSGEPALCVAPGLLPPTLLRVHNAAFFKAGPVGGAAAPLDAEAAAAVAAQEEELSRVGSNVLAPLAPSLSLSVMIQADMPLSAPASAAPPSLPSNVIVVLQELREDGEEPLVMRVELGQGAPVPLARATFHIPSERLSAKESEPLLFWVRLYTQASVSLSFGCGVPVQVGAAETIWAGCGQGRSAFTKEGSAPATAADTEQVVFRLPLRLQGAGAGAGASAEEAAFSYVHVSDAAMVEHLSCSLLMDYKVNPSETANSAAFEAGDLLRCAGNWGESRVLPRLGPCRISLGSDFNSTLMLRCLQNNAHAGAALAALPGFSWKTVVLTRSSLLPPANLQTNNKPARYIGAYYPNNSLALFKDVISVDAASFPLALKFGVRKCADTGVAAVGEAVDDSSPAAELLRVGKHTDEFLEMVRLKLVIKRKVDGRVMYSSVGNGKILMYNVTIDAFLPAGVQAPVRSAEEAPPADAKAGKKDDKKGKAGAAAPGGDDVVELVIELFLDETAMHVPDSWRSRLPYVFNRGLGGLDIADPNAVKNADEAALSAAQAAVADGSNPGALPAHSIPRVLPQFLWHYDVLAGTVHGTVHDYRTIERLNVFKKRWDDLMPGREESAIASLKYFTGAKALTDANAGAPEAKPTFYNNDIIKSLETAIWSKYPGIKERLDIINPPDSKGNPYIENIVGVGLEPTYVFHEDVLKIGEECDIECDRLQKEADAGLAKLGVFNAQLAEHTKARIKELIDAAYAAEAPNVAAPGAAPTTIAGWWEKREKYRRDTDTLNQSLRVLLNRATEAIEKAQIAQGGGDPKKKGGKK